MDSPVWQLSPAQFKAFVTMVLLANYKPLTWVCPRCKERMVIPRGGLVFSPETIAKEAGRGVSREAVRRAIANLESFATVSTTNRPRCHNCYVLNNYGKFNPLKSEPTESRPLTDHQPTTDRPQVNQGNKENQETIEGELFPDPRKPTWEELELADRQRELHLQYTEGVGVKMDKRWQAKRPMWALAYAKLRGEVAPSRIRLAMETAYANTRPWADGTRGWRAVLAKAKNPAESLCRNIQQFLGNQRQAQPERTFANEMEDVC